MTSINDPGEYTCNEKESASHRVIAAVSEATDCEPTELDPLYEYIDLEAIDTLFRSRLNGNTDQDDVYLEFTYTTYHVTVTADSVHINNRKET